MHQFQVAYCIGEELIQVEDSDRTHIHRFQISISITKQIGPSQKGRLFFFVLSLFLSLPYNNGFVDIAQHVFDLGRLLQIPCSFWRLHAFPSR